MPIAVPPAARDQTGAFTRRQARAAGATRKNIRRALLDRRWTLLVTDVFTTADAPATPARAAWTGHLATGGVVSHTTAAQLHGILAASPGPPHVITPGPRHIAVTGVEEHRVRLDPCDIVQRGALPVTSRERTVLDLLAGSSPQAARTLLFRAVQQGWIDQASMRAAIERHRGMHGNTQLRELVRLLSTGAHSVAEVRLHAVPA